VFFLKSFFFTALILFFSETYVLAQSAPTPEPLLSAETFSTGTILQDLPILDTYYDKGKFEDWTLRCVKTNRPVDPCQLFQLMYNADGTPVAEFNLNVIKSNGTVVAGANVITPLETLLTAQLIIRIDEKKAKAYPFLFCLKMGCVARIGLTTNDMESYHTGNQATVTMVPAGAPGQQENLLLSLAGFTAGHKALIGN
tara:strand:- start:577 stop:1170 length:594 start_codon:yes stop_codon:yes gene_type:complete